MGAGVIVFSIGAVPEVRAVPVEVLKMLPFLKATGKRVEHVYDLQ